VSGRLGWAADEVEGMASAAATRERKKNTCGRKKLLKG
jgi:hypothetical protein